LSFIASTTITNNPTRNYNSTLAQRWHTHLEEADVEVATVEDEEDFLLAGVVIVEVAVVVSQEEEDEVSFLILCHAVCNKGV
jgi:hypothetical protein